MFCTVNTGSSSAICLHRMVAPTACYLQLNMGTLSSSIIWYRRTSATLGRRTSRQGWVWSEGCAAKLWSCWDGRVCANTTLWWCQWGTRGKWRVCAKIYVCQHRGLTFSEIYVAIVERERLEIYCVTGLWPMLWWLLLTMYMYTGTRWLEHHAPCVSLWPLRPC